MKFPLPTNPFPALVLSHEDERRLKDVAEMVVKSNAQQYHELLAVHNGVVDEHRWKKIKQRDDVCVYRERQSFADASAAAAISASKSSSLSSSSSPSSSSSSASTAAADTSDATEDLATMLTFGSVTGNLNDIMYGFLSPSAEEMQLKSAYVGDGFVDWAVLASIIKPSTQDPFRDLSIKWMVKGHPLLIGAVMRARDVVVIESVGIAITPNGERIGYHLHHSVDIPEIRELHELQIVRGRVSLCQLFRQRKENCVEVCAQGFIDLKGRTLGSFVTGTAAEVPISVRKHAHCAEMKKLTRLLGSTLRISSSSTVSSSSDTICAVCDQSVSGGTGLSLPGSASAKEKQCCKVCSVRVCSRCRVSKTVYLSAGKIEKELNETSVEVCTRCMLRVSCASSATFAALDALAGKGESIDYSQALE